MEELGLTKSEIELLPIECALWQGCMGFDDPIKLNGFIAILNEFKLDPGGGRSGPLKILKQEVEHRGSEGSTI